MCEVRGADPLLDQADAGVSLPQIREGLGAGHHHEALSQNPGGSPGVRPQAIARAEYSNLLASFDLSALGPYGNMNRGEVAQVLHNLLDMLTPTSTTTTSSSTTTTTASSGSPLEIVSAHPDAAGNDNENLNDEYITFRVLVSGNLLGYAVEDESGHRYDFPDRVFSAGQVFALHTGIGVDTQTDLYWGQSAAVWNNGGDTVYVLDPQDQVVAGYSY